MVVDDEPKIRDVVQSYLESSGYEVIKAADGREALILFERYQPTLVILDLMLPDMGILVQSELGKGSEFKVEIPKEYGN